MKCTIKKRQIRSGNKPGRKTVRVKPHKRTKPSKCKNPR